MFIGKCILETFVLIKKIKAKHKVLMHINDRIQWKLTGLPDFGEVPDILYTLAYLHYAILPIYTYNTRVFANACVFYTVFRSSIILAINRHSEPLSNHSFGPTEIKKYITQTQIKTNTRTHENKHARTHTQTRRRRSGGRRIRYISHCLDRRPLLPINNTNHINIFKRLHWSCLYNIHSKIDVRGVENR